MLKLRISMSIKYKQKMKVSSIRAPRVKEEQFIFKQMIGKGSFGQVEKCEHKQSNKIYAIKTIQANELDLDNIQEEARNMIKSNSEYVLELIDHFYDNFLRSYVLVTPYYKMGSFEKIMNRDWEVDQLLLFFYEIAKGLFDLEKNKILHLDLKPENILIKAEGQYVLCDLGCSRKLENNSVGMARSINIMKMSCRGGVGQGTTDYASPDLILHDEMTPFTDIWSLGVILYKVIFKRHPLYRVSNKDLIKTMERFYEGKYQIPFTITEQNAKFKPIIDIVTRMLVSSRDREKRITWQEILNKILDILKLPQQKPPFIITNFDNLLSYADNINILLSAFIYYYEGLQETLKNIECDIKAIIKAICIYLLTITKETAQQTKEIHSQSLHFYLFKTTRKHLTKKQKSYAECLEKQAKTLAEHHSVAVQYGSLDICREQVAFQIGKFYKQVKKVPQPANVIKAISLQKLKAIADFISFKNELKYEKYGELLQFVKELIAS